MGLRKWIRNLFRKKVDLRPLQSCVVIEMGRAQIRIINAIPKMKKEDKAKAIIEATLSTYEAIAKIYGSK